MTNRVHFSGTFEDDVSAQRKLTEAIEKLDPDASSSLPDWIAYGHVFSERQRVFVAYALHYDWGVHAESMDALIKKIGERL